MGAITSGVVRKQQRIIRPSTKSQHMTVVVGVKTADFEPEAIWDDAYKAVTGAAGEVVKAVTSGAGGAISNVTRTVTGVTSNTVKIAQGVISGAGSVAKQVQATIPKVSISVPKIEVPKISLPTISVPKIEAPKISLPVFDVGKGISDLGKIGAGAIGTATIIAPITLSMVSDFKIPTIGVTGAANVKSGGLSIPDTSDLLANIKCGVFGCEGQEGALEQLAKTGQAALNVLNLPSTVVKGVAGVGMSAGGDLLKGLPDLSSVQKATQSLATTALTVGLSNPLTAPATIAVGLGTYASSLFGGKSAEDKAISEAVAKANEKVSTIGLTTGLEERIVSKPLPGPMESTSEYFRPDDVFHYGEDRTDVATCTVRRGTYLGFVKKYKYSETLPNECVPEGAVKYYTSLGNYKQKEMVGVPKYADSGRIEMYDPDTGVLIQEINEEEIASGSVSINEPETSLVYQGWATEPSVGNMNIGQKAQANRFAITGFRDEDSERLEAQVDTLNATEGGDYLMVDFSRLGAELYGGKVSPIDGRVLNPDLVTQETDYGKKIGLDFPVNNVEKLYGDLGEAALGKVVSQKIVDHSNEKGAISALSEKAVKGTSVANAGTVTNGFVIKNKTECSKGDIFCDIGKKLDVINPNSICAENSTNIMCQGLRGVENTALQITEGVFGAVPSLADIAYDTTTGAIEKMRGLDEGTLARLGARSKWDGLFEKTAADVVGVSLDKEYFSKSLGLDKVEVGVNLPTAAKLGVGLFEDFLSHPVEWLTPGIIEAELIMQAPSLGETIAGAVTGKPKAPVKYSYLIDQDTGEFTEIVEEVVVKDMTAPGAYRGETTDASGNTVIEVIIYTDDQSLDGKVVYSETPPIAAVSKSDVLKASGVTA